MREFAQLEGRTASERVALADAALATAFDPAASAADAVGIARRALGDGLLLAENPDSPHVGSARYALFLGEDLDAAELEARRVLEDARARGSAFAFGNATTGFALAALSRGRLAEVIAHGEALIAATRDVPRTPATTRFFDASQAVFLAVPLATMGEFERAREVVAELSTLGDLDTPELCVIRYGRAVVELADGDYEAALADFVGYGAVCAQVGYEERFLTWRLGAARVELALGRRDAAVARADEALAIARTWGAPGGLGAALRTRALVSDPDAIGDRLAEAVEVLRGSLWRLELAGALADHGIALRTAGRRLEAREALEQGMDLAARCEAKPLLERAREELIILGARPRRLRISGLDALTGSERRVAAMAADGMTNREIAQALFVTPKTIEKHLANAYRKLDITSRGKLPAELAQIPR
jgi:DNA-binding CsgD family transcriptional regulator